MSDKSNKRRKAVNAKMRSGERPARVVRLSKSPKLIPVRPRGGIFDLMGLALSGRLEDHAGTEAKKWVTTTEQKERNEPC